MFNYSIVLDSGTVIVFCIILIISLYINFKLYKYVNKREKDISNISFIMQHLNLNLDEDKYTGIASDLLKNINKFKSKISGNNKIRL